MKFCILGLLLVLVSKGWSQPGLQELADFYHIKPDVTAILPSSSATFHIALRLWNDGAVVSLELIDENAPVISVRTRARASATSTYWNSILDSSLAEAAIQNSNLKPRLRLQIRESQMEVNLRSGLIALAQAADLDAVKLLILEQRGGPAESFIVVTAPSIDRSASASPGRLAAIDIPTSPADNVFVVDPVLTEGHADVAGYIERIARHKRNGYHVIGLGSEGIAFRKGDTYLFETYQGGKWIGSTTSTSVASKPPAWVDALSPQRPFVARLTPETRRDVHAALAVCSESTWRGEYGYASDPAVWAVK